ncbi:transcriptional regulator [Aquamicrobium terrae]
MYQPPHHVEDRLEVFHALIRAHPLGLLVSAGPQGPTANALPFLLDADAGPKGRLRAHMARANGQWREIAASPDTPVLVIFQGVDTYITPSWYATKRETGKVVPTWNYAMVQARGRARVVDDRDWLAAQIDELTRSHENGRKPEEWHVTDAPASYIEAQIKGIIGLEIEIVELQGKWKVSQNRPAADRAGVVAGLADEAPEMAELVRRYSDERDAKDRRGS